MKFRLLLFFVMVCLSVSQGFAQEIKPEPPLVREMLQDGWTKVAEGVLQRNETGQVETFTYGEDGLRWTARRIEVRLESLQKEYDRQPTEQLAGILRNLEAQLIETDQVLKSGAAAEEVVSSEELDNCSISYWATAAADPQTGSASPGVQANATAYFHANCGWIGNTYAYGYARATEGTVTTTKTQEDPKYNGGWLDSAASVAAPGRYDCYSEAFGRAWSPQLNINYEVSDYNYSCPVDTPPVSVWIDGPYEVYLDPYYNCETVTWYAYPSGGNGVYNYQWYFGTGTAVVSTGSTYSRTFCNMNQRADVRVVVSDTSSPVKTGQATFTTWIYYQNDCSTTCTCYETDPWYPQKELRPVC